MGETEQRSGDEMRCDTLSRYRHACTYTQIHVMVCRCETLASYFFFRFLAFFVCQDTRRSHFAPSSHTHTHTCTQQQERKRPSDPIHRFQNLLPSSNRMLLTSQSMFVCVFAFDQLRHQRGRKIEGRRWKEGGCVCVCVCV